MGVVFFECGLLPLYLFFLGTTLQYIAINNGLEDSNFQVLFLGLKIGTF